MLRYALLHSEAVDPGLVIISVVTIRLTIEFKSKSIHFIDCSNFKNMLKEKEGCEISQRNCFSQMYMNVKIKWFTSILGKLQ